MSAAALEIIGLCKRFGGLPVTQDLSMRVAQGERRLIIGPNGAGKTTLFNQITGDLAPNAGSVRLFGQELVGLPTQKRVTLGMSRTYQILTLFNDDTMHHNVVLSLLGHSAARWNPWAALHDRAELRSRAADALARVGLSAKADLIAGHTSYGDRRRLELAMALAQNPKLLLLDEPLAGLSHEERDSVREVLLSIPRDVTVIMIEHDMDVALAFAEQITLLNFGQVVVEGTRAEVVANPKTREVYLGE